MVKEQKRLVKFLGEGTLIKNPEIYIAYGIMESYETQLKNLMKSIDNDFIKECISDRYRQIAGWGSIVTDPNMPLALEALCEEIEFYLDWCARKIPVEEIPKEFNVGTATIYNSSDQLIMWG